MLESATLGIESARKTPTGITDLRAHLARIDAAALTPTERARVDRIRRTLASVEEEHQAKAPRFIAETTAAVRKLRMLNVARVAGQWIAAILGKVLLFTPERSRSARSCSSPRSSVARSSGASCAVAHGRFTTSHRRPRGGSTVSPAPRPAASSTAPGSGPRSTRSSWPMQTPPSATACSRNAEPRRMPHSRHAQRGAAPRRLRPDRGRPDRSGSAIRECKTATAGFGATRLTSGALGSSDDADDERIFIHALQAHGIRFDSAPETVLATIRRLQEKMQDAVIDRDVHSAGDRERRNDYGYGILDDSV